MKLLSINIPSLSTITAREGNASQDRIQTSNAPGMALLVVLYTYLKGVLQVINKFFQARITTVVVNNQSGQVVGIDVISTEGSFLPTYPSSAPREALDLFSTRQPATPLAQSLLTSEWKAFVALLGKLR